MGFKRYREKKCRVCGKDSIPLKFFQNVEKFNLLSTSHIKTTIMGHFIWFAIRKIWHGSIQSVQQVGTVQFHTKDYLVLSISPEAKIKEFKPLNIAKQNKGQLKS